MDGWMVCSTPMTKSTAEIIYEPTARAIEQ
jgi:hypothetical protein